VDNGQTERETMRDESDMKTWKSVFLGIVIGFLAGVGTMQATLVGDVREHATKLNAINHTLEASESSVNNRIDRITRMMESILESNRQLLAELAAERRRNEK
jgi:uncharacterized protein YpmS